MQGNKTTPLTEAIPGDIVAVTKVEDLHIGDTVSNQAHPPKLPPPTFPTPMFGLAVEPKARGDEQKISGSSPRSPTRIRPSTSRATRRPRSWSSPA